MSDSRDPNPNIKVLNQHVSREIIDRDMEKIYVFYSDTPILHGEEILTPKDLIDVAKPALRRLIDGIYSLTRDISIAYIGGYTVALRGEDVTKFEDDIVELLAEYQDWDDDFRVPGVYNEHDTRVALPV